MTKNIITSCLLLFTIIGFSQNPIIKSITPNGSSIGIYKKFEADIEVMASFTNPYDYNEIEIRAFINKPSGKKDTIDAFYTEVYDLNTTTGGLQNTGQKIFKIRYTPDEAGTYEYTIRIKDTKGQNSAASQSFLCVNQDNNKGFVRTSDHRYLYFDNGDDYIAVGENMCWQNNNAYLNYKLWLDKLAENGGNFIRQWHCSWGIGMEWSNGNGYTGLKKYNQTASAYQDWLFDYCDEKGIKVMLALNHHGQVSTQVNPNWNENPYNAKNGGPCANTWDFFTNTTAKSLIKNRLRYIIARWGYSKSVLVWELFNEVEWTDNFQTHKEAIIDWHIEMASYIKQKDVFNHLVSTSLANDSDVDRLWNDVSMDITQTHFYNDLKLIHAPVAANVVDFNHRFNKPNLVGEFGLGGSASLANLDAEGIHIHNTLWSTLFSGSFGTGMTWWWDNYIHPQNLYHHFKGPAAFSKVIPFHDFEVNKDFTVSGANGDLELTPSLGWGQKGDTNIEIKEGQFIPAVPKLSSFLYGSQYNTQFRSPPIFKVQYETPGTFSIKTGNDLATNPKIKISLDGNVILEQTGEKNKIYTINVPAGIHNIAVDNSGTDWITISYYSFSDQGQMIEVYHLQNDNKNTGSLWIYNKTYNHVDKAINQQKMINDGIITINNVANSNFLIEWYDTKDGKIITQENVTSANNKLVINIPQLEWDIVLKYKIDDASAVKDVDEATLLFYPNPVQSGQKIFIDYMDPNKTCEAILFDSIGKMVLHKIIKISDGIEIPTGTDSGKYNIQIKLDGIVQQGSIIVR